MTVPTSVVVDGVTYTRKPELADTVLVRSHDAGVFYGHPVKRNGDEIVLSNARRVWYWAGAATLSQLAVDGTSKPTECKFPVAVNSITILGVCEIIPMTVKAVESLDSVPVWSA